LLDPDFREIGASGRLWTRTEMISALAGDCSDGEGAIEVTDIEGMVVGPDSLLLVPAHRPFLAGAPDRCSTADRLPRLRVRAKRSRFSLFPSDGRH
jgi:hypothetical protein